MTNAIVPIGGAHFGNSLPLAIIAGPCQIESREHALEHAIALRDVCRRYGVGFVYKSSFDKANRTSGHSPRGVGFEAGLQILNEVWATVGVPVITDVHEPWQCEPIAAGVSALQIPALLCRQTDLIVAAAKTRKPLNIKKGQFLAPQDMANVLAKAVDAGNSDVMLCERGTSFGYHTLVSDMRALAIMAKTGAPVIFDATHSVQEPGGLGTASGGKREFVGMLACAAVAAGVAGVFLECHRDPDRAASDGPVMLTPKQLEYLLPRLVAHDHIAKCGGPAS
jgi:2-dehydro-3-deoxyphosphooctonate aldolase (KDO 8-P synthase)